MQVDGELGCSKDQTDSKGSARNVCRPFRPCKSCGEVHFKYNWTSHLARNIGTKADIRMGDRSMIRIQLSKISVVVAKLVHLIKCLFNNQSTKLMARRRKI